MPATCSRPIRNQTTVAGASAATAPASPPSTKRPIFTGVAARTAPTPAPPQDLFGEPEITPAPSPAGPRPLADRLRPTSLDEVVGQDHLVGPDGTLTRMLARGSLASLILWGPPGVGKTTIARLLAARAGLHFVQISAVFSGVADLKRVFEEAARRRRLGEGTLLFVDEIHRFNRAQQDGFLPVVEDGTITLIGATTENPSFELNGALLSRCQVLVLRRLDDAALEQLLARAEAGARPPRCRSTAGGAHRAARHGRRRRPLHPQHGGADRRAAGGHASRWTRRGCRRCSPAAPRCTTRTGRSTTTSSPRCISRCAARIRMRRCIGSRACWPAARTPATSPAA